MRSDNKTSDISYAYANNTSFHIPGYGKIKNFRDFFNENLSDRFTVAQIKENFNLDPNFANAIDSVLSKAIKNYNSGGLSPQDFTAVPSMSVKDAFIKMQEAKKGDKKTYETTLNSVLESFGGYEAYRDALVEYAKTEEGSKLLQVQRPDESLSSSRLFPVGSVQGNALRNTLPPRRPDSLPSFAEAGQSSPVEGTGGLSTAQKEKVTPVQAPTQSLLTQNFSSYVESVGNRFQSLSNELENVNTVIQKRHFNTHKNFKDTFIAERRKAIENGTLYSHTFEYMNPKTQSVDTYHARNANEQKEYLKKQDQKRNTPDPIKNNKPDLVSVDKRSYKKHKKDSAKAQSFRNAYAAAKDGEIFTWDDKEYIKN